MVRTSVVCAACLFPWLVGCGALRHATARVTGSDDGPRAEARAAWRAVQNRYPERPLSDAFRAGFLDGYTEYVTRGTGAPLAPALDAPSRDYDLGFRYAADVARANEPAHAAPVVAAKPPARVPVAAPAPERTEPALATRPKPELPVIKPFNPLLPGDLEPKFVPHPVPPGPDRLPVPDPPLPIDLAVPPPSLAPLVPEPTRGAPTILDEIPPLPFVPRP